MLNWVLKIVGTIALGFLVAMVWRSVAAADRVVELPVLYHSTCDDAMYQIYAQDYMQLIAWDQENKHVFASKCGGCE